MNGINRRKESGLTIEKLKSCVSYNKDTGEMLRIFKAKKSSVAGHIWETRYRVICINYNKYYAHRLAWFYVTGSWPKEFIDHKNGNGLDNSWSNLRECSKSENNQNKIIQSNNSSGLKGIWFDKINSKWRAGIRVSGKDIYLGRYDTPEEAHLSYRQATAK